MVMLPDELMLKLAEKRVEMIQVKNCSLSDITIDNITIPSYGETLLTSIEDKAYMNKLINKHLISIHYVSATPVIDVTPKVEDEPIISKDEKETLMQEETTTPKLNNTKKRGRPKDTDTEAEKSNLKKGDMNDATD